LFTHVGEHLLDLVLRNEIDRDLLTHAVDRAISAARDRLTVRTGVGRDEEDLILLDIVIGRQDRPGVRSTRVDREAPRASYFAPVERLKPLLQGRFAADPAGKSMSKFPDEGRRIDPAARAGDGTAHR